MGARSKFMLARATRPSRGRRLLAPGSLQPLESHCDECLRRVFPVSRLRPRHDKGPGRERERFVETKTGTFVSRPDTEVRVQADSTAFLSASAIRPILGVRGHQVAAVFAQVKARLRLDEVFDVDHAEALAVVEELVVFVVAVRSDR